MKESDIPSREFAQDPLKVKQMVKEGVVFVTNRGERELAILPYEKYRLIEGALSITALEALSCDEAGEIDFEAPQIKDLGRGEDLS